jgi:hypothetical protein
LLDIYWNILTMHVPINVKSPNNISNWQMGFNSAFKGLNSKSLFLKLGKKPKYIFIFQAVAEIQSFFSFFFFKICKSVHHRTIQIDHQPDTTVF